MPSSRFVVALALFPAALISTISNARRGHVDFRLGMLFELPTMLGAWIGAHLTGALDPELLKLSFGLLVGLIAVRLMRRKAGAGKPGWVVRANTLRPVISLTRPTGIYRMSLWLIIGFGLFSGTLAGTFGVGGGFLKTPIMVFAFGLPAQLAVGTSLFMITITTLTASISHYSLGHLRGDTAFLVLPFIAGAVVGNMLKRALPEARLMRYIAIALLSAGLAMVIAGGVNLLGLKGGLTLPGLGGTE